ncbi:MAG: group II intron reverse transcriptase/maturase [Candidatus Dormibacteraeota bacterium]|nr:group II intron reverse transcriptase/maturase [Candidatus Dormibacteraeota bacterium]
MPTAADKPFDIPRQAVWEAYKKVAANKGAPGVDRQTLAKFEQDLEGNLYKIWNRMSSGSYMPPPVRAVEIPKLHGGGVRLLGVPTFADRVAQTVVAMHLEVRAEPRFLPDSYGYRPGRSALDAVGACRERCWKKDWVLDCDVERFFDTVPWELVTKAVEAVTNTRWVLLYVRRWLAAPLQYADGTVVARDRGTPQGSAVSPILANLFMHYAFDKWMERKFPSVLYERYADDVIVHCVSKRQAQSVRVEVAKRMEEVGLRLHPDKTRIVYCKDGTRRGEHEHTSFTFLGFTFRQRQARNSKTGRSFSSFLPAMSTEALKAKGTELRRMRVHRHVNRTLNDLARWLNPIVRGWMQYYGRFHRSAMYPLLRRISTYLMRWAWKKYRRLRTHLRFQRWWRGLLDRVPELFAHWQWVRAY